MTTAVELCCKLKAAMVVDSAISIMKSKPQVDPRVSSRDVYTRRLIGLWHPEIKPTIEQLHKPLNQIFTTANTRHSDVFFTRSRLLFNGPNTCGQCVGRGERTDDQIVFEAMRTIDSFTWSDTTPCGERQVLRALKTERPVSDYRRPTEVDMTRNNRAESIRPTLVGPNSAPEYQTR